jgi:very-short-patch-repair endonuclease
MQRANPSNNYHYNPGLKHLARELRKNSTTAEVYIWTFLLRDGGFRDYRFLRQRPVLNYIVDFMCKELMLVIEIDGSIHDRWDVKQKDAIRQERLEQIGFTVLRFRNEQVLHDRFSVFRSLLEWMQELKST